MQENKNTINLSIFCKAYWKSSMKQFNKLTVLTVTALMIAINVAISAVYIPVGLNLNVYFSFIPTAIASLIGGPFIALSYGFICDIIGFIIHPSGPFFPGYVVSAMLGALIYALFFYRNKITIPRIILCKLTINVFVNILLNSLWSSILYGKGYYYFFAKSIVKNFMMLPIEIIILITILKAIVPLAAKMNLIPYNNQERNPTI